MLKNMNIVNGQLNQFDIQPVGRISLLIQTCLESESKYGFSHHADRNPYSTTDEVAFWGGVYPKPQGCLMDNIPLYSFFLEWCTHFREKCCISVYSV